MRRKVDQSQPYWWVWVEHWYRSHVIEQRVYGPYLTEDDANCFSYGHFRKAPSRVRGSQRIRGIDIVVSQTCPWY